MSLFNILIFICTSLVIVYAADGIKHIADHIGKQLSDVFENATNYSTLSNISNNVATKNLNTTVIEKDIENLRKIFSNRLSITEEMRDYAESTFKNHTYDYTLGDSEYSYFNAQESNKHFLKDNATINFSTSSVQTPTDLYQYTHEVLNSIEWTKKLDTKFRDNFANKSVKLWQYIGLSNGVFRSYPGTAWLKNNKDLEYYDVRQRSWYIEGASSPKDMVIIIDLSGSVIGNRLLIIRSAVMKLLDTLQENDFVNIIYFNKNAHYLKKCWKDLVQATERNIKILKAAVKSDSLKGKNVANVDTGFKLAFEILMKSRKENNSSDCTQTIAFFTDGVEGDTVAEDVFDEYNKDKRVRIFTYLVGRENGSPFEAVKWIACTNKGFFYRIETLSDVRESIVKYIIVLSRSRKPTPRWTPLYLDAQGRGMVYSVVVPIFDTKTTKKKFLGVLGSDVLLNETLSQFPEPHLGPGGYPFSITNNGLVLFHPLLKQEKKPALKHPTNIYLSEVLHHFDDKSRTSQLAEKMIKRETKTQEFNFKKSNVLAKYNDLFRVVKRKLEYSYDYITNTSFSVGIAITDYGSKIISAKDELGDYREKFKGAIEELDRREFNISIGENWPYCPQAVKDWEQLKSNLTNPDELVKCRSHSEDLINLVLYDIIMLRDKDVKNSILNPNKPISSSEVKAVFFGTTSGLTFSKSVEDVTFGTSIKQEYFERAADSWEEKTIIFSAASKNEVHASKAVVVQGKQNERVLWGVVGIHMNSIYLKTLLYDDCKNKMSICYLVDENGYVVLSEEEKENGKFFGKVDVTVMESLIEKQIYTKYNFTDVQATCKRGSGESSSSIRLLDPLFSVVNYAKWWTQTIALSLIQYSLYALMTGTNQVVKAEDNDGTSPCFKNTDLYFRDIQDGHIFHDKDYQFFNGRCNGSYKSYPVIKTNLLLVIVTFTEESENSTFCKTNGKKMNVAEVVDLEGSCDLADEYRVPGDKFDSCVPEIVDYPCSSGKLLIPSIVLLIILQFVLLLGKE